MNAKANTAPPRILLVGLPCVLPDTDQDEFYTDKHFLDYDIVIIDPQGALKGQGHDYTIKMHDGVLSLKPGNGDTFHKRYVGITQKLVSFVNKGGLAIVFLRPMPTLEYVKPDGLGQFVALSLDGLLPYGENTIHRAHGSNIEFTTQGSIGRFWETTNGLWSYEAVYDDPPARLRRCVTSKTADRENGALRPRYLRYWVSPGHAPCRIPRKSPGTAGVFGRSAQGLGSDRENADWLAVHAVSSEPVSPEFPVKQGKNREFLRIWPK